MLTTKHIKILSLLIFTVIFAAWVIGSNSGNTSLISPAATTVLAQTAANDDFVGSETCRSCHEPQFDSVAKTTHGKLEGMSSWEGKAVGCESCHGPGREHVEGGGDVTKIKVFKDMDPKAVSETCLTCHTGREAHNNFRRGDHWRNNVGCTDCHTAHGPDYPALRPGSITYIGEAAVQRPSMADKAMLKVGEPQLCIGCHTETKAQFSKPFRHKVLEGTMTCSDCHNPHGGFESKQTRAALGSDQSCVRCHTQMQGPFVFEHAPLKTEGCAACHTPHGSNNPKMLKRSSVRQMCLECHTNIFNVELDPNIPTGPHTQTSIRTQNCTVCHSQIHGSNSSQAFFR